jgi:hypothetical protein
MEYTIMLRLLGIHAEEKKEIIALNKEQTLQKAHNEKQKEIKTMLDAQQAEIEAIKKKKGVVVEAKATPVEINKNVTHVRLQKELHYKPKVKDPNRKKVPTKKHAVELQDGERVPLNGMSYNPFENLPNRLPTTKHVATLNSNNERIPHAYMEPERQATDSLETPSRFLPSQQRNVPREKRLEASGLALEWKKRAEVQAASSSSVSPEIEASFASIVEHGHKRRRR